MLRKISHKLQYVVRSPVHLMSPTRVYMLEAYQVGT